MPQHTLTLAPGVTMVIDADIAASLHRQLSAIVTPPVPGQTRIPDGMGGVPSMLDDDHPLWEQHAGGEGHRVREWASEDTDLAEAFYASTKGKAKVFIDLMIDNPGRLLDVNEICELRPDDFSGSRSIAGALNGLHVPCTASGRRYPFYWWASSPTRYAMKPLVASLFRQARRKLGA